MKPSHLRLVFFGLLLATMPNRGEAAPNTPKFPDFPDNPTPGGEGGGGDKVPTPAETQKFAVYDNLYDVRLEDGKIINGRIHFKFATIGPVMRYNIIWSRPGKEQTDMRWAKDAKPKKLDGQEYIINEIPMWDTDYTFKVQAESGRMVKDSRGAVVPYQITGFTRTTFHVPPRPPFKDSVDMVSKNNVAEPAPRRSPLSGRVDERVRVIPHPPVLQR